MTKLVFGNVKHPAFLDRPITKGEGQGQNNLGKRRVNGVVLHRMIGTLFGTDGYFRNAGVDALTDYGVGVPATDGAENDGLIIRWNDPLGFQSGWASGPVNAAYGDGLAFVNEFGINAVNRDQASIEISGNYDTPITAKVRDSIARLIAYWADQAKIPWDVFPIWPGHGYSFIRYHQEFTIGTGKVCPGKVVMDATPDIIERARAIMKAAQVPDGQAPQPYPIWWDRGDVGVQANADGTKVLAYVGEVTAKRTVPLRQAADAKSPKVAEVGIGKTAVIVGGHRSKAGRRWAFIEYAPGKVGRALMSAFEPQFPTL